MKAQKIKQAAKDGQAAGAWLAERAAHVLLAEYSNRRVDRESETTQKVNAIMGRLRSALNSRATEPAIAEALQALDGAIWDCAVEHEDRAWHAAWTVAMSLKGNR